MIEAADLRFELRTSPLQSHQSVCYMALCEEGMENVGVKDESIESLGSYKPEKRPEIGLKLCQYQHGKKVFTVLFYV